MRFFDDGLNWIDAGRGYITERRDGTDDFGVIRYDEVGRASYRANRIKSPRSTFAR